ncbi:hypothetical protein LEQ35_09075 [Lactiplantibacillus argentoratensis]|uniref:SGNH/GDSL hydrolase family protein n=1 Tax=Lactiplantibacillus argentoratensis TaxID=271881 RepID=UPI001CE0B896|nr:SGNH/GDSL hydrolase family protein [Lactiplantibacillus argentoratensis]MCA5598729.1 hypothetical protein [Lactiplantibacillus argentoratensis]
MAIQLVTDQFSDNLDGTFRNGMVGNFKIVEQTLNELLTYQGNINKQLSTLTTNINTSVDGKLTKQDSDLVDKLKAQSQDLTERISHVIMGTDTDSIHAVLSKMLLDGELRGQRGDAGKDGRDGLDGESAYQIWLDAGNVGSKADYLASMKGKPGDKGPVGPAGKDGAMSSADVDKMVDSALSDVQVGGRNYLVGSSRIPVKYASHGYNLEVFSITNQDVLNALVGQTIMLQAMATAPSDDSIYLGMWYLDSNKNRSQINSVSGNTVVRSEMTDKLFSEFLVPDGIYTLQAVFTTGKSDSSGTVWHEQLELGSVAHDWSPAPEDKVTDNHDGSITVNGQQVDLTNVAAATSILKGKTLDIIGDSYVANNGKPVSETWHYKIANQHSMKYNNYGINGNGLITTKATGTPVVHRVSTMDSSADYIVVVGGKNDYNQQLAITDFKSGLVKLIQELVERFVGKKICFFTPWSIVESETMNIPLSQYSQAIEDVCGAYSIPCFNSAKRSGILAYNGAFQAKYFQTSNDSSHLNDAGHNLFVNPATKFLESL